MTKRPPHLQDLVARFGGYDKITPGAWVEYDRAMAEWHVRRRAAIARELKHSLEHAGSCPRRASSLQAAR
jgi:hypothetical protein